MAVSFHVLDWCPVIENNVVVAFVATTLACPTCARVIVQHTDAFLVDRETRQVTGGRAGNIHWRTKGHDVAIKCDFCDEEAEPEGHFEEFRFSVLAEVPS